MAQRKRASSPTEAAARPPKRELGGKFISTIAAARICGVSTFSIQRWFDAGLLSGSRLPGGRRRISAASFEQFMRKHIIAPRQGEGADAQKILLVDDDAKQLSAMRETLELAGGFAVRTATTGMEAGLALSDFQPDCLVLDVTMEGVPGAVLVRRIRDSQAGRTVRIVAISARSTDAADREIMEAGANACLSKPFAMGDLIRAVTLKRAARN